MSKVRPDFKRMLLKLPHDRRDYAAVGVIAELADLFGVDLIGTYVEDLDLRGLTELPNVREFRAGAWRPFSSEQLAHDVALAAREAERLFLKNAGQYRPKLSFRLAQRTDSREADIEDIIVVIEPNSAIERATHQFTKLVEAAFRSTSSILLVPSHARRPAGPIIVVTSGPDDPAMAAALAVASSCRERLILIPSQPSLSLSSVLESARAAGVVASCAEAAFHRGNFLLPASVTGRLLIISRKEVVNQPTFYQTPTLLVSSSIPANAAKSD